MRTLAKICSTSIITAALSLLAAVTTPVCDPTDPPPPPPPPPQMMDACAAVSCSSHGNCTVVRGNPTCACESGYHAEGLSCVPNACVRQCGSRVCGGSDGCGGTCGTCSGTDTCNASGQCVPQPPPPPPPPPPPSSASLKVNNYSSQSLYYLYVSPCGSDTWGPDQLGSRTISSGSSLTLTGLPCPACYDLKVETSGHAAGVTRYGNNFSCGVTYNWNIGG